ncbi:type II toxin-antitoxin system VapC family toxin [Thermosynechococcus sp. B0]|uniref:type II toxin-antitoxin system VapC family toxin n=2 Tax=unclassified Thermosynechococcus TaxID=2622553 RepID=UPI00122E212C|nr:MULTISPECIES: type II toxin-antitoxin system VapC family toxin [unclassified Thermosynechococcus]QEQ01654.1 type II toxin-antitoxin system VapC family toxin [Thermosynechococcus sp. CL-1]WJI23524.1 type II toxin-antitoxin system VapC family toxin [Thermosynechococcus sp. B0]WKT83150.1 type II toxin-antitoxin system VapC family toxin [Thermosynechococcus sp. HY596]WNC60906.1 type II toxin-antitoxin system VapC family toxin [Thermosynechococcus sp. QS41]WNC62279.1 type II toxin-antitoxin syst
MTSAYLLLDTNILSYIMKGAPEARLYENHLFGTTLAISFITVGELWAGAEYAGWGEQKRKKLESVLRNFVVIPYDYEIAKRYGEIVAGRKRIGKPISFADAWIAACALCYQVPLVTHNEKDFQNIPNLSVITQQGGQTP